MENGEGVKIFGVHPGEFLENSLSRGGCEVIILGDQGVWLILGVGDICGDPEKPLSGEFWDALIIWSP